MGRKLVAISPVGLIGASRLILSDEWVCPGRTIMSGTKDISAGMWPEAKRIYVYLTHRGWLYFSGYDFSQYPIYPLNIEAE